LYLVVAVTLLLPVQAFSQTAPSFTSTPVTSGLYGSAYGYTILTTDFEADAREIDITSGTLPNGLTFTDNGDGTASISGTALEAGDFPLKLRVQETLNSSQKDTQTFTISISKATLTATANNQSRAYGSTNPTLVISYTGFVNGESSPVINTPPTAVTGATITSPVAIYPITVAGGLDDNYDFDYVSGMLTITKATLTATADNQSRAYGSTNPTLTISYSGFLNGDVPSDLDTGPTAATTATITSPVATYSITVAGGSDDNYDFNYVSGALTITKATLSATADNQSRAYGSPNPTFTISYSGFVNGDDVSDLDTAPTATTTATITSPVATYSITVAGGSDDNYDFNYVSGTLTITKATLTITAYDKFRVYGDANPSFNGTYSGEKNGETFTIAGSTSATVSSAVGPYAIIPSVTGATLNNYNIVSNNGTLTITPATLTITAADKSRIYGDANPSFGGTYTGEKNGEAFTVGGNTVATALSAIGSYVIIPSVSGGTLSNYNVVSTNGTLTITLATLTITADDKSRIYGDANPSFSGTYTGEKNGETFTVSGSTAALSTSPIGTYAITPSVSGVTVSNYNIVSNNGTLTITKIMLTVTADNKIRIYGSANPAFTITVTGFKNGETLSILDTAPSATTTATQTSNVGTYNIVPSGGVDSNYDFTYVNGTLTITKATLTVTADNQSRLFNSSNPVFTINYSGFVNSESPSVIDSPPTATTSAVLNSTVGAYPILVAGGTDNNYLFSYINGLLTITKATPVITWSTPSSITYGTALSATQLNATSSVSGNFTYTPGTGAVLTAGTNQILTANFTPTDATNYNGVTGTTVQITVIKASPDITWPNPSPITYGTALSATQLNASASVPGTFTYSPAEGTILNAGTNQLLTVNFTPTDIANYNPINGRTALIKVNKAAPVISWATPLPIRVNQPLSAAELDATASTAGTFNYTPVAGTSFSSTGNYTLSVSFTPTDLSNFNVVPNTKVQILVSNKDNPVVTWTNPTTITYGTTLSGSQLNATASVPGNFVYNPPVGTLLNAGGNQILSVSFTPSDQVNYNNVSASVQITVDKAILTAAAVNASRIYGATNPALSATYSGFVNGETIAVIDTKPGVTVAAIATSSVGVYPINVIGGADNNYSFAFVSGILTITKASLTATAKNQSRTYGSPNPTFTIIYSGFVNGDTESQLDGIPIGTTSASIISPVGNYTITASGGFDNNYSIIHAPGSLVIGKATLTAIAANQIRLFGTPNPPLTIIYNGFFNGDSINDIDTPPIATTTATASSVVGTYSITVAGGTDNNYNFNYVPGTLTVTPNFPPSLFDFQIEITEDQTRMFMYADFGNNFSSFSGSPITTLKIVSLPVNGTILWKGTIISVGQSVTVQNGLIDNLVYVPNLNYNGFDSFKWNASDGVFFAQKDAVLTIRISSVNDSPVLSNIESEPIEYSLGDPAVLITSKVLISDIDNNFIHSAKILISENFFNGDRLSIGFGVSPYIVATFNPAIGELVLTGKESKSNYEMAITKVSFSSPVSGVAGDKKIVITVNDSTSNSNPASRIVRILEIFPEVDVVNSFTPNDDGVNDYWDFINLEYYSKIIISVFDRNGFKVYSCFDENCKWDGKMDGKELPAGTYYYTIDLNDGKRKYQSAVTILK